MLTSRFLNNPPGVSCFVVSEGTGRLRSMIYGRLEEMSFRSGAAICAGVLVVAGMAIALSVTLAGQRPAPARAAASSAALPSVLPSSPAAAFSPSARPSARHARPDSGSGPAADYLPEHQVTPAGGAQASPAPWPKLRPWRRPPTPGRFPASLPPGWIIPWPWVSPPPGEHHRHRTRQD